MKNIYSTFIYLMILMVLAEVAQAQSLSASGNLNLRKKMLKPNDTDPLPRPLSYRFYLNGTEPLGGSHIGYRQRTDFTTSPATDMERVINGSLGRGLRLGIGVGYPVCDRLDFNMDAFFFQGCDYRESSRYTASMFSSSYCYTQSIHGLNLAPSVILRANPVQRVTPYGEFGAILPVYTRLMFETDIKSTSQPDRVEYGMTSPKFQVGLYAGVGANYKLRGDLGLSAQLNFYNQTFTPDHSEVTKYTEGGEDKTSQLTVNQKETDYVKNYTYSTTFDPTKPNTSLAESLPYSSFGLSIGLTYKFNKGASTTSDPGNVGTTPPPPPPAVDPPKEDKAKACVCGNMSIQNNPAGNPKRTLKMEKSFDKGTQNHSFKFTIAADVDMSCTNSTVATPCEGTFIVEILAGGGTAGFKKVLTQACGATATFPVSVTSFYGSSTTSAGLDKINSNVKVTFIMVCDGQMKRISQTMEIMGGELVNTKWGAWENVNANETKKILEDYSKSSTEYLKK
jgi:hypothetical protein